MLAKSLKVAGPGSAERQVTISPCTNTAPPVWPLPFANNGLQGATTTGTSRADSLQLNSTCAVVKIVPGLAAGSSAVLRLPAGARYSPIAGPVVLDTDVQVGRGAWHCVGHCACRGTKILAPVSGFLCKVCQGL